MLVRVTDNSYVQNKETGDKALLVPWNGIDDYYVGPDEEEDGAMFVTVSDPYMIPHPHRNWSPYNAQELEVIDIESSKTHIIYQVDTNSLMYFPPETAHEYFNFEI